MTSRILIGDSRARMRELPAGSVHCCITSPPYLGLRDYDCEGQIGREPSIAQWLVTLVDVFRELHRVLRNDGVLFLNVGDAYANDGKRGGETGGKRVGREKRRTGLPPKSRMLLPARLVIALQDAGWVVRDEIVWFKSNPMPSSVTDRTTPAHEMLYLLAKRPHYFFDSLAIAEPAAFPGGPNAPGAIKSPHGQGFTRAAQAVPSGWDQENTRHDQGQYRGRAAGNKRHKNTAEYAGGAAADRPKAGLLDIAQTAYDMRNKRSVWAIATEPFAEAHFATFATRLVEPCLLAGTSHRGVCPDCGAPWRRIERVTYSNPGNRTTNGPRSVERAHIEGGSAGFDLRLEKERSTLGWYPPCRCAGLAPLPKLPRVTRRPGEVPARWRARKERTLRKWEKQARPLLDAAGYCRTAPSVVLDPFSGAGTTLLVAERLGGRDGIGIEINPEYAEMAARRLAKETPLFAPKVEHAGK